MQTKICKFSESVLKVTIYTPSNVAVAKNLFSIVYFLFHLFHLITERQLSCYHDIGNSHVLAFFEKKQKKKTGVLKEVHTFYYFHNNIVILTLKFQEKLLYSIYSGFSLLEGWEGVPHTNWKFARCSLPGKILSSRLSPPNFYPPFKGQSPY